MLPLRHHSFLEVMLGAENFMPAGFGMVFGRQDLGQLWPQDINASWGEALAARDVWSAVGDVFEEGAAAALVDRMDEESRDYFRSLFRSRISSQRSIMSHMFAK